MVQCREGISTFQQYADKVFIPFLKREFQPVNRVDIVWDRYLESSIKGATREKRGAGLRRKVNPQTKIPAKWNDFLRDPSNKVELFSLLTDAAAKQKFQEEKELYVTSDQSVISIGGSSEPMPICTHEEADTRIIVHLFHSVRRGNKKILIRTVDTVVLVILLGEFDKVSEICPDLDLWIALGMGKDFAFYSINTIYNGNSAKKAQSLPVFHAFSGCDTTSSFNGKGKKSVWEAWKAFPEVTNAFLFIRENPFEQIDIDSPHFETLERFTVIIYDKTSGCQDVNESRRELFCKKSRNLENLPPTQDVLAQHVKRVIFQSSVWSLSSDLQCAIPLPND